MSQTLQTGPPNPQELSLTHNVCQVVESSVPHASQYFSKLEQNTANVLNANATTNTRKRKRKRAAVGYKRRKRNIPEISKAGVETELSKIENVASDKATTPRNSQIVDIQIEGQKATEVQKLELPSQIASTSTSVKTTTTTTTQRQILQRKCKTLRMQNKLTSLIEIKEEDTQKSTSRTKKCKKSEDLQHKKLLKNLKKNARTVSVDLFEGLAHQHSYADENPLGQSLLPVCYPTHFREQIVKNTEEMTLLNLETENPKIDEDIINEFDFDESLQEFFDVNYFPKVLDESNKTYNMTTLHVKFLAIFLGIDADYLVGVFERLEPMPDDVLRKLLNVCWQGDADLEVIPETPRKKFNRHFKPRK